MGRQVVSRLLQRLCRAYTGIWGRQHHAGTWQALHWVSLSCSAQAGVADSLSCTAGGLSHTMGCQVQSPAES